MSYIKSGPGKLLEDPKIGQLVVADRALRMMRIDTPSELDYHRRLLSKQPWLLKLLGDLSTPCKVPYLYQIPLQMHICLGWTTRQVGRLYKDTETINEYEEHDLGWRMYQTAAIKVWVLQPHDPHGSRFYKTHVVCRQHFDTTDVRILNEDGTFNLYPESHTYGGDDD